MDLMSVYNKPESGLKDPLAEDRAAVAAALIPQGEACFLLPINVARQNAKHISALAGL